MNIILFEGERVFYRSDDRYTHIRKILKKGPGDTFRAGLIDGPEGLAVIESVDEQGLAFSFQERIPPRPLFPLWMIIGFPRPIQLKRLLRDLSGLGVSRICLTGTALGEKSYRDSSLVSRGAAREALIEGCMQAGGTVLPILEKAETVQEAIALYTDAASRVLLDNVSPVGSLASYSFPSRGACGISLAVGSERGWTDDERALFAQNGYSSCSMGKRILRTETAACAAASITLAVSGLMERDV